MSIWSRAGRWPARNAVQALALVDEQEFDVVIIDFRIEGINGPQLARAIHERVPYLPVIVITQHGVAKAGGDIQGCVATDQGLFPTLVDKIRVCVSETERQLERT